VSKKNFEVELNRLLRGLCENKKLAPGVAGVIVLKIPDDCWQLGVTTLLKRCAVVVIDLTNLTQSLAWELSAALEIHPPERIIIAARVKTGESDNERREAVLSSIREIVGPESAETFPVFLYPDALGRSQLFLPPKQIVSGLVSLIQETLSRQDIDWHPSRAARVGWSREITTPLRPFRP
jgi:hypothetical protein